MKRFVAAAVLGIAAGSVFAQGKEIKIGVLYDLTGPFAAGGSQAAQLGTKYAIDMINERGGVEGVKIRPVYADAQSKADVAINETERLLSQEKVDMLMGVFSSAHCVPMAQKAEAAKKFFWMNVCVATAVLQDKNYTYSFRAQVHGDQAGEASCSFLNELSKARLGKDPKDLKVAIIHEDGPYGTGIANSNDRNCKRLGIQVALKEGYAATSPDLSPLITKLKRARPDVILHTGYNPDITLFLRQSKEQGLKWSALIGHGAGYGQFDKLYATFKEDANLIYNVDPVAAQLINPSALAPGLGDVTKEMVRRYKAETKADEVPPHVSMGFNQSWIFFTDVLPRAIKKYGGFDSEALRKAALETDIPPGGTIQGYGVKFFPPGQPLAGQNERSVQVVMQYNAKDTYIVWPTSIKTKDPVLPLPKGHTYSLQ
jgi:branched-chain amino acid transport system substrate-binding protein